MSRTIKKGDEVVVISGESRGERGKILQVIPSRDRVLVEGVNMRKRHEKKTQDSEGGIVERESAIHISNVMLRERWEARAKSGG
ncbi:MAG: 50S ribosomal protein L24 [Puniceicoccaceae bacterium]